MSDPHHDGNDFEFDKDIDVDVDFDFDVDVDIDVKKDVDIDVKVDSDVDLDGNFAQATFDVEAMGSNTFAQADVVVLTIEHELSSVTGVLTAASD
jgi:hypothetical protein